MYREQREINVTFYLFGIPKVKTRSRNQIDGYCFYLLCIRRWLFKNGSWTKDNGLLMWDYIEMVPKFWYKNKSEPCFPESGSKAAEVRFYARKHCCYFKSILSQEAHWLEFITELHLILFLYFLSLLHT